MTIGEHGLLRAMALGLPNGEVLYVTSNCMTELIELVAGSAGTYMGERRRYSHARPHYTLKLFRHRRIPNGPSSRIQILRSLFPVFKLFANTVM